MDYNNIFAITFNDIEAAKLYKNSVETCLDEVDAVQWNYGSSTYFKDSFLKDLKYDGDCSYNCGLSKEVGFVTPEDSAELVGIMARRIAMNSLNSPFTIHFYAHGTYSEIRISVKYDSGKLITDSVYYPEGYWSTLYCPECGGAVIDKEDYEEGKTYICPDCGEAVKLDEQFKEEAPITEHKEEDI